MLPKPASRSAPRRRSGDGSSPAFRPGKIGVVDVLMAFAGLALLAGVGYIAFRTQMRGESIDTVLPFLAEKPVVASKPVEPAPARASVPAYTPPPIAGVATAKTANPADSSLATKDPTKVTTTDRATSGDNLFGTHYQPTKPPPEDEYEYGEQTVFGRVRRKKTAPTEPAKDAKTTAKEPVKEPAKK